MARDKESSNKAMDFENYDNRNKEKRQKHKSRRSCSNSPVSKYVVNKQDKRKTREKKRRSINSSSSSSGSDACSRSSSSGCDGRKRKRSPSLAASSPPISKRVEPEKRSYNSISSESKNNYQQKVCLFLEQVDYDSDQKERVKNFLLKNVPKKDEDCKENKKNWKSEDEEKKCVDILTKQIEDETPPAKPEDSSEQLSTEKSKSSNTNDREAMQTKNNLEELEKITSSANKPVVRPSQLTVLDKFGNFRLISATRVSESPSRARSVRSYSRSRSRDGSYRNDRETYRRSRSGWHNKRRHFETNSRNNRFNSDRNRDKSRSRNRNNSRSRNRQEKSKRKDRRSYEKRKGPDDGQKKFDETKIPDENNFEQMEEFLAKVREAKRKKMMEENKDILREKS